MPPGQEDAARAFYAAVLDLTEVEKPAALRARGGAWFVGGACHLHLGVQEDFRAATKAHPALAVDDLDAIAERLREHGYPVDHADPAEFGVRFYTHDPFGNRLEFIEVRRD